MKRDRKVFFSLVVNLYLERDVLMDHTNNIVTGKQNVPQTVHKRSFSSVIWQLKICVIGDSHLCNCLSDQKGFKCLGT